MAGAVQVGYTISKAALKMVKAGKAIISSGGVRLPNGAMYEMAVPSALSNAGGGIFAPITMVSSLANNVQSAFIQHGVNVANDKLDVVGNDTSKLRMDSSVIKKGISNLNDGVNSINTNIGLLSGKIGSVNSRINLMDDKLDVLTNSTSSINNKLDNFNNRFDTIQDSINILRSNQNITDMKLDNSLLQLNQIQSSLRALNTISALSWATLSLQIVNCGVSIIGFKETLEKIGNVSHQIEDLSSAISKEIFYETKESFDRYTNIIRSDIPMLSDYHHPIAEEFYIKNLSEISAYLRKIRNKFVQNDSVINGKLACNIIFGLTVPFAQEVQYFTARYYYKNNELPGGYVDWTDTISSICSQEVTTKLRRILNVQYMDQLTTREQSRILDTVNYSLALQMQNMAQSLLLADKVPEETYLNFDQYLLDKKESLKAFPVENSNGLVFVEAA